MKHKIRFYYPDNRYEEIIEALEEMPKLHSNLKLYEKTAHYNHCNPEYDFYADDICGRFRLRISHNELNTKCKLTWKRRLLGSTEEIINEERKEIRIEPDDIDNFVYIIENVMHFKLVKTYERYRTIYENNDIEIAVDEYPFGICLEFENKSINKEPEEVVLEWIKKLGLDISKSQNYPWDEMYEKLCKEQKVKVYNDISFDKPMPHVK